MYEIQDELRKFKGEMTIFEGTHGPVLSSLNVIGGVVGGRVKAGSMEMPPPGPRGDVDDESTQEVRLSRVGNPSVQVSTPLAGDIFR